MALTSMAQLVGRCPTKQLVAGLIPGHGTTQMGWGFGTRWRHL